ncbi:xanthine dehydrogenase family protein subunit M [Ferrovibrio sp. MS7]|uniref:FAD binding domain-containing protein n=1 Tax=Ferrovibrio plantarum TaxID=3119164 RepID=UPI003136CE8E
MKPSRFEYTAPTSLGAALQALQDGGDDARVIAGGQSLIPMMNFRLAAPEKLIDLRRVQELTGISQIEGGLIRIGAMTRHRAVETSDFLLQHLPLLPAAMAHVAHVPIRNRGTIGGSLAHADPAAEWPALCLALDATMVVAGPSGERLVPAADFAQGVLTTALEPGEILKEILFPAWPAGRNWGFTEIARRRGDFAIVGVACIVDRDAAGIVAAARIVVFGASDTPVLSLEAAEAITGKRLDAALARGAGRAASAAIEPRSDLHASADYRSQLIEVLVGRALQQVLP